MKIHYLHNFPLLPPPAPKSSAPPPFTPSVSKIFSTHHRTLRFTTVFSVVLIKKKTTCRADSDRKSHMWNMIFKKNGVVYLLRSVNANRPLKWIQCETVNCFKDFVKIKDGDRMREV